MEITGIWSNMSLIFTKNVKSEGVIQDVTEVMKMQWDDWLKKVIKDVSQEYQLSRTQGRELWLCILRKLSKTR